MIVVGCKASFRSDEWHGWGCEVTGGECMYARPNSKQCAREYGEGPDANNNEGVKGLDFNRFKEAVSSQFNSMAKKYENLFVVDVDRDDIWDTYLNNFPAEANQIFRVRREHDCTHCKQFIRQAGGIVAINSDFEMVSIWDINIDDEAYQTVANALSAYVKGIAISNRFVTSESKIGIGSNVQQCDAGFITWEHLSIVVPPAYVNRHKDSIGSQLSEYRSTYDVFKRSLNEISLDSIESVLELTSQGALYKGEEWANTLKVFLELKERYEDLPESKQSNFAWRESCEHSGTITRLRNTSMGTLLVDISEGVELDSAVRSYETIVAPQNYKRPKAIFTKKMVEDAKNKLVELGYANSIGRRFANADDIKASNILFMNRDETKKRELDPFESLKSTVGENSKKLSRVSEVTIEKFIADILPTANHIEVLFENGHCGNLMSLIAPKDAESKSMLKWDNGFSWAYDGNVTDSMKERVKNAGGKVDGVLRFSIQWNDIKNNHNDFDAHCIEPRGNHIFFGSKCNSISGGNLDVDIQRPNAGVPAVENITWPDARSMQEGVYKFYVNNYADRGGEGGFRAEIEFEGQVYSFDYQGHFGTGADVVVAEVTFSHKNGFSIKTMIDSDKSSVEKWGVKTNNFVPVSMIMLSPNYWEGELGTGNKHYFFILRDCINPDSPNGFYNEFLDNQLMQHKRVFEALGSEMRVAKSNKQLSGLGFSSTKHTDLTVKVCGNTERIIRIKF